MTTPTIYDFRIDAWQRDTLPMGRLAEYLSGLAKIFGNREQVHFIQVRKGSAIPEIHVQETCAPKVHARLLQIASSAVPEDAVGPLQIINKLLREDNASAVLRIKKGALIIPFPGCKTPLDKETTVVESGELIGTVIRVGGKDDTVPLLLQDTDGTSYRCTTTRAIARELACHLFGKQVRIQGTGTWLRTADRIWVLEEFVLKSWEMLNQVSLANDVITLRAIDGSHWNTFSSPQDELKNLRKA
jgi:hypothetical protein